MADSRIRPPDPAASLKENLAAFLAARGLSAGPCYVGLSGGCDSVSLLHLLAHQALPLTLSAVHVHHGLSAQADAWADFCADFCARLGVPLTVRRVAVSVGQGEGLEAAARRARYGAFHALLPPGASLLLAQHRGDQAETVLFNLMRGSGVQGLAAMRPERSRLGLRLLRPLLDVPRQTLEDYARTHGLSWVEDASNDDTRFSRNFLRQDIMPALARRFPAVENTLAQTAQHCAEAAELLDALAANDWRQVRVGTLSDVADSADAAALAGLRALPLARLKNLLRWRLRMLGWQVPTTRRLEEFCRQIQSAGPDRHPQLQLSEGSMRLGRGRLFWQARDDA